MLVQNPDFESEVWAGIFFGLNSPVQNQVLPGEATFMAVIQSTHPQKLRKSGCKKWIYANS